MTYTPIAPGTLNWDVPVNAAFVDQDTRITANTATDATQNGRLTALETATDSLDWQADEQGFVAWTYDPLVANSTSSLTAGTVFMAAVKARKSFTLNNINILLGAGGTTLTAGQNFAGVYNDAGTLIGVTADQSASWATAGYKTMAVTSPSSQTAGNYYVAIVSNASTVPTIQRQAAASAAAYNAGLSAAQARWSSGGTGFTGLTSLPGSVTMSNRGSGATTFWAAIN